MKRLVLSLAGALLLCNGFALGVGNPANFLGADTRPEYFDDNIKNGVVIGTRTVQFGVTTSSNPAWDLDLSVAETTGLYSATLPLVITSETLAQAPVRNVPLAAVGGISVDTLVMSKANALIGIHTGQEFADPLDVSFSIMLGGRNGLPQSIAADDFYGSWTMEYYSNHNLRNTAVGFVFGSPSTDFEIAAGPQAGSIALSNGPGPGWVLLVDGNRAYNPAALEGGIFPAHGVQLLHVGNALAFAFVGIEPSDPTDVSVTFGVATPVPEPDAYLLMFFSAGVVGWQVNRVRRKVSPKSGRH